MNAEQQDPEDAGRNNNCLASLLLDFQADTENYGTAISLTC